MALTFDADKEKSISMLVETSGIENKDELNFVFNIIVDNVRYGFPCILEGDKVKISVPALSKIINGVKSGKYKASLDVSGDSKCFLQPFKEDVNIVKNPKMNIVKNLIDEIGASISKIIDEDINTTEVKEEKVITEGDKKVSKVDKIFN